MQRDPRPYRDFEFNLRELAGSMGDFGTLFPLAIGLIAVNRMDPVGLFVVLGLTNIVTGLIYRLPMPVEPKKVVSVAAIGQGWPASMVAASGLGLGLVWFALATTGAVRKLVQVTPDGVIRGIQLALGITLAVQGVHMSLPEFWWALIAIAIILLLRQSRYAPASLVIMALGVGLMAIRGDLLPHLQLRVSLPRFTVPTLSDVWQSMVLAGFAQIPLTITNACLATAAMIRDLFPHKSVSEERLLVNMGAMNVASSFFGGMPMCHGSGGLAGQYYFGARTGGTNILEGLIELALGIFLGHSLLAILSAFPMPLVGGMMFMVGIQMALPAARLKRWPLALAALTAGVSLLSNMAIGFAVALLVAWVVRRRGAAL
ncbi:MAG: putative sulfate/molybdate transporter [Anaerolineae bacterium]|jgi:MFS superfamily sulfate permease-like transporter